jgi:hypothetical protein
MSESHQQCVDAGEHLCQKPSGRRCHEQPCDEPAGTWWGPHWCPNHDKERLDRISASLDRLGATP